VPNIRSQSAVFMLAKKVSLQLLSEQSVGDVWIVQLDQKRIPQASSSSCRSSVAVTAQCSRHQASRNVSWPQSAKCCRTWGSNHLSSKNALAWTATGKPDMPLWTWHALGWV